MAEINSIRVLDTPARVSMPAEDASEASLSLGRALAIVELVRHYHESKTMESALQSCELGKQCTVPEGFPWPGEIAEGSITAALYGAFSEIRSAQAVFDEAKSL